MSVHYLVTGGAGFIGVHLVRRLAETGCRITVIDDFSTGNRLRLACPINRDRIRVIEGDIRDTDCLAQALDGVDGVFHLAAKMSVADCVNDWLGHHSINSTATLGVFDLVRRVKPVPVVYASSAAVYGNRDGESCNEEMVARPISPYGADKLACENQARAFWSIHRIPSAGLRFFNVYGPGQRSWSPYSGVLTAFADGIGAGVSPEIHGDGLQTRDFVHVADVVEALMAAMGRLSARPEALVCNVCTGASHKILDIAMMIADILQTRTPRFSYGAARVGDIRHSRGDPDHMQKTLDLGPFLTLQQGLTRWLSAPELVSRAS